MLFFLITTVACEEVVDAPLEESAPRLVVEASLVWETDEDTNPLYIRLTTTAPYFDEEIPPALGGQVSVFHPDGEEYIFEETEPGIFKHNGFSPETNVNYELHILYKDEEYKATETFITTPEIDYISQDDSGGFTGENIELRAYYTDPAGIDNYYFFQFFHEYLTLQISDDELTDGNQSFAFFSDEDLESGDEVQFVIQGISEGFYNYMYILQSQAGSGGGPFQTQPTIVRGNIINTTNPDNFPFGYFRLSAADVVTYEVE